jgi:hypothetical protein
MYFLRVLNPVQFLRALVASDAPASFVRETRGDGAALRFKKLGSSARYVTLRDSPTYVRLLSSAGYVSPGWAGCTLFAESQGGRYAFILGDDDRVTEIDCFTGRIVTMPLRTFSLGAHVDHMDDGGKVLRKYGPSVLYVNAEAVFSCLAWVDETSFRLSFGGGVFEPFPGTAFLVLPLKWEVPKKYIRNFSAKEPGTLIPLFMNDRGAVYFAFLVEVVTTICQHTFRWFDRKTVKVCGSCKGALVDDSKPSDYFRRVSTCTQTQTFTSLDIAHPASEDSCPDCYHSSFLSPNY